MESPKRMRLYDRVERIWNEVRAMGDPEELDVRALAPYDHLHYHGTDAVDHAVGRLGIGPADRVLDVGAGLGGPARYLALTTGCAVDALELQDDIHLTAEELTRRARLAGRVRHLRGNILDGPPAAAPYDALVSYLCILHIPDRERLLRACRGALRPGGRVYIEDFTLLAEPDAAQREALRDRVQCSYLPSPSTYVEQLEAAGFRDVALDDVTASWRDFTASRLAAFRAARARHVAVHGDDVVDGLDEFYGTVAGLYADGVLGGARIVATA